MRHSDAGKRTCITRGREARPNLVTPAWPLGHGLNDSNLFTAMPFRAAGIHTHEQDAER